MDGERKTVFQTEWFSIEREFFRHIESLDGKPYYRMNGPDGVLILALTDMNEIILVKQFRPALNEYTLEIPCGSIGDSESPQQAAVREFYEETGYACRELDCLGSGRVMTSRSKSREFAFFGTGALKDAAFEAKEDIEVVLVTPADFKMLVLSGQFEQFAGLALLVLADWKLGNQFVQSS